jgi:protein-S-isoprenylcysteine O-methyltransferase Ste14
VSSFAQPATPSSAVTVTPHTGSSWLTAAADRARAFLIRRRVPLSIALFSSLVIKDIVCGHKPHDVTDLGDLSSLLGLILVMCGLTLRSWAAGVLCKETMLTRTGPYSLIRNPLYVGSFLMMFGFCKLVGDAENLLFIAGPVLWLYLLKVRDEEQGLAERFPAEWSQYVATTPRYFPRRITSAVTKDWNLSQWLGSREYHAVASVLMAFVALKIWRIL